MEKLDYRKYCPNIVSLVFFLITSDLAQTNISAGAISGTWLKVNSPYKINGEVTIPNDSTLTIEPGVEVLFTSHHKFNVQGRLLAIGTQTDSIKFIAEDKVAGWHGIRFMNTPITNDTSRMVYCSFKYGKANTGSGYDRCGGAIMIKEFDKVLVSNCLFDSNMQNGGGWSPVVEASPAIYIYYASPAITNSTFSNNTGSKGSAVGCITCPNAIISNNKFLNNSGMFGPIAIVSNSKGIISGNIISNNVATWLAGGILIDCALVSGNTSPRVENNIIIHNQAPSGGGIVCYVNSNPVLINNTIAYNSGGNGGGIYCYGNSNPIIINNILFGNSATSSGQQVFIDDNGSNPIFKYCNVQGGKEGFGGIGAGSNYTVPYENNIDANPSFVNTEDDFRLTNVSQCIGAGTDSVEVAGVWYYAPSFCKMGNPRPSPVGSNPDIGAYENTLGTPTGVEQEPTNPTEFVLYQNYPNPFNPSTKISWRSPLSGRQVIKVFDVLGNEVATLVNEVKEAGYYSIDFNTSELPSGVYFYRIQSGSFIDTKKMILLR